MKEETTKRIQNYSPILRMRLLDGEKRLYGVDILVFGNRVKWWRFGVMTVSDAIDTIMPKLFRASDIFRSERENVCVPKDVG